LTINESSNMPDQIDHQLTKKITSLLAASPADQYSLYKQLAHVKMSDLQKVLTHMQQTNAIEVWKYRKSKRSGLEVPVYSLTQSRRKRNRKRTDIQSTRLDVHPLLSGITSERLVEYDFVSRNLVPGKKSSVTILDIGSGDSHLVKAIRDFGKKQGWQACGIDISNRSCDAIMDARHMGFRNRIFDFAICVSTLEHIGLLGEIQDEKADIVTKQEILRTLKRGGFLIITVPYGNISKEEHRIYRKETLDRITSRFSITKKEFYLYDKGKWKRCNQSIAESTRNQSPLHFHSAVCACLLLRK
jgi:SAM-dependent methyltransferase